MVSELRVGVVGGSIGGTAAAVLLARAGHSVTLFERSERQLEERGGGIGMSLDVVRNLQERDLSDDDVLGVVPQHLVWCVKDPNQPAGRVLGRMPLEMTLLHWDMLFQQLFRRADIVDYRAGAEVTSVREAGGTVHVTTKSGAFQAFDLLVGADGYRSRIRSLVFPAAYTRFAGYPAWRGILPEHDVEDVSPVMDVVNVPGTRRGHAPFEFVPATNGDTRPGRRRLNRLWYDASDPDELRSLLEQEGLGHDDTVHPGLMPPSVRRCLHERARDQLPAWHADVVMATPSPHMQPIYDVSLDHSIHGRVCLLGDAATVARPHTVSGSTKAIQDAIALAEALQSSPTLERALDQYDDVRTRVGRELVEFGRALGEEQVTDAPDWMAFNEGAFRDWFASGSLQRSYLLSEAQA